MGVSYNHISLQKGTVLGDGCVVGVGAGISRNFPANSVIVRNPAMGIRTPRVNEEEK